MKLGEYHMNEDIKEAVKNDPNFMPYIKPQKLIDLLQPGGFMYDAELECYIEYTPLQEYMKNKIKELNNEINNLQNKRTHVSDGTYPLGDLRNEELKKQMISNNKSIIKFIIEELGFGEEQ
jgi:hypothetical protein